MNFYPLLSVPLFLAAMASAAEPSPGDLIANYANSFDWEANSVSVIHITTRVDHPWQSLTTGESDDVSFIRNNDAICFRLHSDYIMQAIPPNGSEDQFALFQSGRALFWTQKPDQPVQAVFEPDTADGRLSMLLNYVGPLDGYYQAGIDRLSDALKGATLSVRPTRQTLHGVSCVVADATTPVGKFALWFSLAEGGSLRRLVLKQTDTDLFHGTPIGQLCISPAAADHLALVQLTVDVNDIEKVGDFWIAEQATGSHTVTLRSGRTETSTTEYQRTNLDIHPDFAANHAFDVGLLDGTPVVDMDHQLNGKKYFMRKGKVITAEQFDNPGPAGGSPHS